MDSRRVMIGRPLGHPTRLRRPTPRRGRTCLRLTELPEHRAQHRGLRLPPATNEHPPERRSAITTTQFGCPIRNFCSDAMTIGCANSSLSVS